MESNKLKFIVNKTLEENQKEKTNATMLIEFWIFKTSFTFKFNDIDKTVES